MLAVLAAVLLAAGAAANHRASTTVRMAAAPAPAPPMIPSSPFAWVYMSNTDKTLLQSLVSAKSARLAGSTADVVVLWFGDSVPSDCLKASAAELGVHLRKVIPPLGPTDTANRLWASVVTKLDKWWDFVKLEVFNLVEYRKAVFLDGDTLFLENLDFLFTLPAGTHTDAPKAPFNSGLFVVEPSVNAYDTLLALARAADYDLKRGWGGKFKDSAGLYRARSYAPFYGAETTQGLLHYYFTEVAPSGVALSRDRYHYQGDEDEVETALVHFNICDKPVPGQTPERCARFHRRWQKVYTTLSLLHCPSEPPHAHE